MEDIDYEYTMRFLFLVGIQKKAFQCCLLRTKGLILRMCSSWNGKDLDFKPGSIWAGVFYGGTERPNK